MSMTADRVTGIPEVLARMDVLLATMPPDLDTQRTFLTTYRRTTIAVGQQVELGRFEDPAWVDRWDVAFADLYVSALETRVAGASVARPWRLAFGASADLPSLRLLLLGINAHINYDLPQSLVAVISPEEFGQPALLARRQRDHERIDAILSGRVAAENEELTAASRVSLLDRVLRPLNQAGSRRFLREARQKVWHTREPCTRRGSSDPSRMRPGWPSWRSSAPRRSPTSSRRGRSSCGCPWAASASPSRHRPEPSGLTHRGFALTHARGRSS